MWEDVMGHISGFAKLYYMVYTQSRLGFEQIFIIKNFSVICITQKLLQKVYK